MTKETGMFYVFTMVACTAWLDYRNAQRYERIRKHILKNNDVTNETPYIDWTNVAKVLTGTK